MLHRYISAERTSQRNVMLCAHLRAGVRSTRHLSSNAAGRLRRNRGAMPTSAPPHIHSTHPVPHDNSNQLCNAPLQWNKSASTAIDCAVAASGVEKDQGGNGEVCFRLRPPLFRAIFSHRHPTPTNMPSFTPPTIIDSAAAVARNT